MTSTPRAGPALDRLAVSTQLDKLFVEAGRRAHITARLNGAYGGSRKAGSDIVNPPGGDEGIWVEPLRLLDYVHFHLLDPNGGVVQLETRCREYVREAGYSRFIHLLPEHPHLRVEKRVWVPLDYPAVVFSLHYWSVSEDTTPLQLLVESRSSLGYGWPRREMAEEVHSYEPALQAVVAEDDGRGWVAIWGSDRPPSGMRLGDFLVSQIPEESLSAPAQASGAPGERVSALQYQLLAGPAEQRLDVVVVGGQSEECRSVYAEVWERLEELFQDRTSLYRDRLEGGISLTTPDPHLGKAFALAKASLEDFKHNDPDLGLCYFAGFPAYNFYFASDSLRLLPAALGVGDWEDTREILRMILSYQAQEPGPDTLPGEIWHEMSTTGERISPNFCTFDFPPVLEQYYRWTGDLAFIEEVYPNLRAAVEWGYLMERDGDGFLRNGPEGEMADSAFEDTNMEGSHIAPNLAWCRALRAGARVAALVGDQVSASRWQETATQLSSRVVRRYWRETDRRFEETLRPDGCLDSSWRGVSVVDHETVGEALSRFGLDRLEAQETNLTSPKAFREWKERETAYAGWREALSSYLVQRGDRARTLLLHHRVPAGLRALLEVARVPFTVATGHFPEVISFRDLTDPYVRGCAHQAWSGSCGVLLPVIEGLFGVLPDAARHQVTIVPHLPEGWNEMRLENIPMGTHRLHVGCRRKGDVTELWLHNEAEQTLSALVGIALPAGATVEELWVDGQSTGLDDDRVTLDLFPEDIHLLVSVPVEAGAKVVVAVLTSPAPVLLEVPDRLPRTIPGGTASLPVRLRNVTDRPLSGSLSVGLPPSFPPSPAVREVSLPTFGSQEVSFDLPTAGDVSPGYHTVSVRLEASPGKAVGRPVDLPIFPPYEAWLDGRTIAKPGRVYPLRLHVSNLDSRPLEAVAKFGLPPELHGEPVEHRLAMEPGARGEVSWKITADRDGPFEMSVSIAADGFEQQLSHSIEVLAPDCSLVAYSGFLGCPVADEDAFRVVSAPANYVVRRPHVLTDLLGQVDLFLTSDQHDAYLLDSQVDEIVSWVADGGRLFLFCFWSSAWGRGFHGTYGNVANTRLSEILPLAMRPGIHSSRLVRMEGLGETLLSDLPWATCPEFDFNAAEARPGSEVWLRSQEGHPLLAFGDHGQGRVAALAMDCFGYGSMGTFLAWPGTRELMRRVVRHLIRPEKAHRKEES